MSNNIKNDAVDRYCFGYTSEHGNYNFALSSPCKGKSKLVSQLIQQTLQNNHKSHYINNYPQKFEEELNV